MTLTLLRRDVAFRALLLTAPAAGMLGLFVHRATSMMPDQLRVRFLLVLVFWSVFLMYLVFAEVNRRATTFEMGLPLTPRQIWAARVGALALSCLGLAAVNLAAPYLWSRAAPNRRLTGMEVHFAAGMLLTIFVWHSFRPWLSAVPGGKAVHFLFSVPTKVAILALTVALAPRSPLWALGTLGVAAVLAIRTYRRLPKAFELVPLEPEAAEAMEPAEEALVKKSGPVSVWRRHRMLGQVLLSWHAWPILLVVFLVALVSARGSFPGMGSVMLAFVMSGLFPAVAPKRFPALAHLPVSRRLLFGFVTLPAFAAALAGSAVGIARWGYHGVTSTLAVHLVLCGVLWIAGMSLQLEPLHSPPANRRQWLARIGRQTAIGVVFLGVLIVVDAPLLGEFGAWVTYHFSLVVTKLSSLLPVHPVAALTVAAVVLALMYHLLERQFERSEIRFNWGLKGGLGRCGE